MEKTKKEQAEKLQAKLDKLIQSRNKKQAAFDNLKKEIADLNKNIDSVKLKLFEILQSGSDDTVFSEWAKRKINENGNSENGKSEKSENGKIENHENGKTEIPLRQIFKNRYRKIFNRNKTKNPKRRPCKITIITTGKINRRTQGRIPAPTLRKINRSVPAQEQFSVASPRKPRKAYSLHACRLCYFLRK